VVREPDQDLADVLWQAAKIGCDTFLGELAGGMQAWSAAGLPIGSVPLADATTDDVRVLDIRQRAEYITGHVPGSLYIEVGDLPGAMDQLADVPTVVMCGHGERAIGAASQHCRPPARPDS